MLTGILAPSSGGIKLLGLNPWDNNDAIAIKQRTGVVPEDLALFDNLTAMEYLTFVGRMYQMDPETIRNRSAELLDLLQLVDCREKIDRRIFARDEKEIGTGGGHIAKP